MTQNISAFWAHSDATGSGPEAVRAHWQLLSEHLVNVSALARRLGELALPRNKHFHEMAACCGLLHDFGKYSDDFQKMIRTGRGKCQHAIHGAVLAEKGTHDGGIRPSLTHVAAAIAGHHAGIPDLTGEGKSLAEKTKKFQEEAFGLVNRAAGDCVQLKELLSRPFPSFDRGVMPRFDLFTRMLFSCLVDADRLDSAKRVILQEPLDALKRLESLLNYVGQRAAACGEGLVRSSRELVLNDCLSAAALPNRLLSLTVPTGGGKTLASMAFALKRAALDPEQYRRIIVVIPYLSIIEQNAEVYGNVFGRDAILEHHSGSFERLKEDSEGEKFILPNDAKEDEEQYEPSELRNETENWDAPLIVTTSVRFFESLFSNRPSGLRRVHNIARSIVILDEVQTLPRRLLAPLLTMIKELTEDWGCTFVFCTATQPAFQRQPSTSTPSSRGYPNPRWEPGTIREIVQHSEKLRTALKRVHIDWKIGTHTTWFEIAGQMLAQKQALTVVNLRDHAGELFDVVVSQTKEKEMAEDSCFHLSTRMCAAHRLEVLKNIRQRLKEQLPCYVVSTQLVEAGVDLDFPIVFRALGPLDAIFQAAGRADREGRLTALSGRPGGKVIVFLPEDERVPPNEYKEATGLTKSLALETLMERGEAALQVDSADAIEKYFERYYLTDGDRNKFGQDLQGLREREQNFKFATLAEQFEMISNRTREVFVPYGEGQQWIVKLHQTRHLTRDLWRNLQRYVVGLQPWEFQKASGVLIKVEPSVKKVAMDSEIWIAIAGSYSETKGLKFDLEPQDTFA